MCNAAGGSRVGVRVYFHLDVVVDGVSSFEEELEASH